MSIGAIVVGVFELLNIVIILWCLLSWFPNIRWYEQPFRTLDQTVKPIIAPFRRLIPPVGGIDLSPIIAIITLQFMEMACRQLLP